MFLSEKNVNGEAVRFRNGMVLLTFFTPVSEIVLIAPDL